MPASAGAQPDQQHQGGDEEDGDPGLDHRDHPVVGVGRGRRLGRSGRRGRRGGVELDRGQAQYVAPGGLEVHGRGDAGSDLGQAGALRHGLGVHEHGHRLLGQAAGGLCHRLGLRARLAVLCGGRLCVRTVPARDRRGRGPGRAAGRRPGAGVLGGRLLCARAVADRGAAVGAGHDRLSVRVHLVLVQRGVHLHVGVAGAEDRRQVGRYLGLLLGIEGGRLAGAALGHAGAGEQRAVGVGDRDVRRAETGHAGGDEVDDGLHLTRRQRVAGLERDEDGRAGRVRVVQRERLVGREGHVDLRAADAADGVDRLLQLALDGLEVVGLLGQLGGRQALLVEQCQADGALGRQAGLGRGQPLLVDVVLRHEDRRPAVLQLVRDVVGRQLLGDRRRRPGRTGW